MIFVLSQHSSLHFFFFISHTICTCIVALPASAVPSLLLPSVLYSYHYSSVFCVSHSGHSLSLCSLLKFGLIVELYNRCGRREAW